MTGESSAAARRAAACHQESAGRQGRPWSGKAFKGPHSLAADLLLMRQQRHRVTSKTNAAARRAAACHQESAGRQGRPWSGKAFKGPHSVAAELTQECWQGRGPCDQRVQRSSPQSSSVPSISAGDQGWERSSHTWVRVGLGVGNSLVVDVVLLALLVALVVPTAALVPAAAPAAAAHVPAPAVLGGCCGPGLHKRTQRSHPCW